MRKHPALEKLSYKISARDVKERVLQHLAKLPCVIWENQFNLFDSHDTSRLHNNPEINREEYRGAVLFQFMLPGAASIYYGDEAEIDGFTDSMEGCRYPMPWDKDYRSSQQYRVNHTMANLKAKHPALSKGSVKFLYAEGQILSLARFWEQEAFVCVISTEEEDKFIRLPLGSIGATKPEDVEDVFGCPLVLEDCDSHSVIMLVKAHQSYLFRCNIP